MRWALACQTCSSSSARGGEQQLQLSRGYDTLKEVCEYCDCIRKEIVANSVVLLMSSGDFAGIHLEEFALTKTEADDLIINARNIVFK